MHFDLNEQQKMLQESVDVFLAENNDEPALKHYIGQERPQNVLWRGLSDLGLGAILVPEQYGGLNLGLLSQAVVAESCGYNGAPGPLLYHSLTALAIAQGGSDEQRQKWLPGLASGSLVATAAFAEPVTEGRWLPAEWTVGGPRLTGLKSHVVSADEAGIFLVGIQGGKLAVVEAGAGVVIEPVSSVDATRRLFDVKFVDAEYEVLENVDAAKVIDAALVLHAADAFGAARRCLSMAVKYAGERKQFGRVIGSFQGLKYQLANAAAVLEPCRALYWYAAHAFDEIPDESARMAALTKAHVTEMALRVGRATVEAHGGIGYTWEYPLHVWLKRAMFDRNYLGDPASHRQRVALLNGW
jgi:alkylation response protein AidB-like acyl-CoA dehydrogenase